jgi:hypothetical protein
MIAETDFELESVSDDEDEDLEFLDDLERGSEDGVFVKRSFSETGQTTTKSGKQSSLRDFRDAISNVCFILLSASPLTLVPFVAR